MTEDTSQNTSIAPTLASSDEKMEDSHDEAHEPHRWSQQAHHSVARSVTRASDVESGRRSLYNVTSYVSEIGGEGTYMSQELPEIPEKKDPNLVEWDGPNDPMNPYNW
jgi:hypothetical protein